MIESRVRDFPARDGAALSYVDIGEGRTVLLLHGYLSSARRNWFDSGIAEALTRAGFRVVAPDCRGHGLSRATVTGWVPDVMVDDVLDLIRHLACVDFDLVGYSMGARTAARALVRGLRPHRCVLGGLGDFGVMQAGPRAEAFEDAIRNGEAAADPVMGRAIHRLMAAERLSPPAMLGVLAAFVPTPPDALAAIPTRTLAILGKDDHENGSVEALAALMANCTALRLPGDHAGLVSTLAFREAMVRFLTRPEN